MLAVVNSGGTCYPVFQCGVQMIQFCVGMNRPYLLPSWISEVAGKGNYASINLVLLSLFVVSFC